MHIYETSTTFQHISYTGLSISGRHAMLLSFLQVNFLHSDSQLQWKGLGECYHFVAGEVRAMDSEEET
jgi:hypothetical protein